VPFPHIHPRALIGGVIAGLVVLLVGIWLGGHPGDLPSVLRGGPFESRRAQPVTEQALAILTSRYYRPLDRPSLVDVGLSGMVDSLDDPYSHYIDPASFKASMDESEAPVTGVGIQVTHEPDGLRVINVTEGSPAAEAGLLPDDLIITVGSVSLAGQAEDFGTNLIRGPADTRVTLTFLRDGAEHTISVVRAKIETPVVLSRMLRYHDVRIGYLRLTGFTEGSGDKLRTATRKVLDAGAQALVLDLRGNGGGLISEAINVSSIYLEQGTIMSAVERNQPRRVYEAEGDAIAGHIPMVVLVDHGTASSAEIVTAALQDHARAEVVGTPTYGKGVFQVTERLNNGGAIDLTIGQFFTPDGHNLGGGGAQQGAGITPNVEAPAEHEALTIAERTVAAEVDPSSS
jgi:carboxyl-terminal processing protease